MVKPTHLKKIIIYISTFSILACAPVENWPTLDEAGTETATSISDEPDNASIQLPAVVPIENAVQKLILNQAMVLRHEKAGILEAKVELPPGTQIEIPKNYEIKHLDFRNSSGAVERSSTGFIFPVRVLSVTTEFAKQFPDSKINEINKTSGGLFLFASIVGNLEGVDGVFAAIKGATPGAGFLTQYSPSGKPKFNYTNAVKKRFATGLNKGVDPSTLSPALRNKWQSIYAELVNAVDRTKETPKSYLMMDTAVAKQKSIDFEKTGVIATSGAWSIATLGTAVRHGFANVPCAEFQSELVRQAYQRAGYRITDDFNAAKGNQLIWSNTAAVVNFSMALYKAGWIAWDSTIYRPIVGAFLMNGSGLTPGHTYISAGDDGMIIVDNGAPQGRDLRKTTEKTISIMFQTGVFFLPPGINPPIW